MQYRGNRKGEPISVLGYGCMRFTRQGGSIDLPKAEREVMAAVEHGVNYFDTAYLYQGSEAALGQIVAGNHIRDRIQIATKLPQYYVSHSKALDKYFDEERRRLQTDYVDYYLMHMLTDIAGWEKLVRVGAQEWFEAKKESGEIKNIGFSFHGNTETFLQILDAYDWDFCQIQYNYMDEVSQAGRAGLQAAAAKGIPVIIMEPLRGGRLVNLLPKGAKDLIAQDEKHRTAAQIGLEWLWDQPEVTCVLSGMNSLEMVEENCRIAENARAGALTEEDHQLIELIKAEINANIRVPCTGCRYCMPCPQGVDIPGAFRCYNEMYTEDKRSGRIDYLKTVSLRKENASPSQCIGCGRCERSCPQHIRVIKELKAADRALRPLPYAVAGGVGRRFFTRR